DRPKYAYSEFVAALSAAKNQTIACGSQSLAAALAAGLTSPPDMKQGYPDGQRTRALTRRAGWCLGPQRMSEGGTVEACLAWNSYNPPPLPEKKVRSTVASIAKSEARKHNGDLHASDAELNVKHHAAQSSGEAARPAATGSWHENTFTAAQLKTMTFEP